MICVLACACLLPLYYSCNNIFNDDGLLCGHVCKQLGKYSLNWIKLYLDHKCVPTSAHITTVTTTESPV